MPSKSTNLTQSVDKKRPYFRPTTAQQRRLLFETWDATGDVTIACQKAHVCQGTFYYWKPRFEKGGYEALEQTKSHAPQNPRKTNEQIASQVVELYKNNPKWGKRRLANELTKNNGWVPLVSSNTVKRILEESGLWSANPKAATTFPQTLSRHADKSGQTLNVDLCFVPATHEEEKKLPAVSGSSGKLVIEKANDQTEEPQWPGRVFEDKEQDYEAVMKAFVAASKDSKESKPEANEETDCLKTKKKFFA